jgi:lysophospholipase L1-like esterase
MIDCLIVGDSIAVGTHQFKPECVSYSKGGINSHQWINQNVSKLPLNAKTVIISLGSNDHKWVNTESELRTLRQTTKADRVYWILPAGNLKASQVSIQYIQLLIKEIAKEYGDVVLPITRLQSDGIHPSWAGYKDIAEKTK